MLKGVLLGLLAPLGVITLTLNAQVLPAGEATSCSLSPDFETASSKNETIPLVDGLSRLSGYIDLEGTKGARMFYMYFKNRGGFEEAPLAIWLNGGPGFSSLYGL